MAQKRGVALSNALSFQDAYANLSEPWPDRAQKRKADSVLTWSNILCIFYVVDLSSKWESLKLMHVFWVFFMIFSFV